MDLTSTRTLEWDNLGHQCDKNEDRKNDELLCVDKRILCTFESASDETLNLPQKQEKHKHYPMNFEYFPWYDIEGDDSMVMLWLTQIVDKKLGVICMTIFLAKISMMKTKL